MPAHPAQPTPVRSGLLALACAAAVLTLGCRDQIEVYQIAKEWTLPLRWKALPEGWLEGEGDGKMRLVSFRVTGATGASAEVAAIRLQDRGITDLQLVNMYRQQVGLPQLEADDAVKLTSPVEAGGVPGKLYDVAGGEHAGADGQRQRIVVASIAKDGFAWYFKLAGDADLVTAQRPAFLGFLKGVAFAPPDAIIVPRSRESFTSAGARDHSQDEPKWDAPAHWQKQPAGAMQLAKYVITGDAGGAEMTVSSAGGGLGMNINRWRGQLGLVPVPEAEAAGAATTVNLAEGPATVIELTGNNVRDGRPAVMISAIVPHGGTQWFFKFMGDPAVVAKERDGFLQFLQTVRFH